MNIKIKIIFLSFKKLWRKKKKKGSKKKGKEEEPMIRYTLVPFVKTKLRIWASWVKRNESNSKIVCD